MFALAYASTEQQPFDEPALHRLAGQASDKNRRLDVSGYLNYKSGTFFQYLEGNRPTVLDLMDAIARDGRHRITNLVHLGDVGERLFPDWRMRYLSPSEMRTVRMEDVLEKVLQTMTTPLYAGETVRATVLRLARKLSFVRNQLPMAI